MVSVRGAIGWALVLWMCASIGGQEPEADQPRPTAVEIPEQATSVAAQMDAAKVAKRATRGLKGEARLRQMKVAAKAYSAVATYWPKQSDLVAEASFRRGEILRSIGESGAARGAFEEVLEAAQEGDDFAVRALLEIGHVCRRAEQYQDALDYYLLARERKKVSLRYNNDGREWMARVLLQTFSWKEALVAAVDWESHAEGPVEEVKARDMRVLARLGAKQLAEAEQELEQLFEKMKVLSSAPTKEGRALKKALERMKSPGVIEIQRSNGR